jgi:hypothetical protein
MLETGEIVGPQVADAINHPSLTGMVPFNQLLHQK